MALANKFFARGRSYWQRGARGAAWALVGFWGVSMLIFCVVVFFAVIGLATASIGAIIYPIFATNPLFGAIFVALLSLLLFGCWWAGLAVSRTIDSLRAAPGGYFTKYYSERLRQYIRRETRKELFRQLRQRRASRGNG